MTKLNPVFVKHAVAKNNPKKLGVLAIALLGLGGIGALTATHNIHVNADSINTPTITSAASKDNIQNAQSTASSQASSVSVNASSSAVGYSAQSINNSALGTVHMDDTVDQSTAAPHLLGDAGNNATAPNNATSPNNGQANNSNPNNDDVNNVIVPGHWHHGDDNNNNIVPNGPVINNNDGWNYWHDDTSLASALANNEDRDNQDALNRMSAEYQQQESQAASAANAEASNSAAIVQDEAKNVTASQSMSLSTSAELKSLANVVSYNNQQASLASSATATKNSYMDSLNSDHAYANSVAQDALDTLQQNPTLTSAQHEAALQDIQANEEKFLSTADNAKTNDATGAENDLAAQINVVKSNILAENNSNQSSNVNSAMDSVNTIINGLTSFANSFGGITADQRAALSGDIQQYSKEASDGINLNRANSAALQSIANLTNSRANELEFNAHAASTIDSTEIQDASSAAVSSANVILADNASNEAQDVMNDPTLSQAQRAQMAKEIANSLTNSTNSADAAILNGQQVSIQPVVLIASPDTGTYNYNVSVPSDAEADASTHADESNVAPVYNPGLNNWDQFMNNLSNDINNQNETLNYDELNGYVPYYNNYYNSTNPFLSSLNVPDYYSNYYNNWNNYANDAFLANDYLPDYMNYDNYINPYNYNNVSYDSMLNNYYSPNYLDNYGEYNYY